MTTAVITAPTTQLLQPADVRAQLGIDVSTSDASLVALIEAATALLDGPGGWLGLALRTQTLELRLDSFPLWSDAPIRLACPPVTSLTSLIYKDVSGVDRTVDPAAIVFDDDRCLYPAYGADWPAGRSGPNAVRIRYAAGYAAGKAPQPIVQAIVLQVAAINAMMCADPALTSETVPNVLSRSWATKDVGDVYDKTAQRLLSPYRVFA